MFNHSQELYKFASFALTMKPEHLDWLKGITAHEQYANDRDAACLAHFNEAARIGIPEGVSYALISSLLKDQHIETTPAKLTAIRIRAYKACDTGNPGGTKHFHAHILRRFSAALFT